MQTLKFGLGNGAQMQRRAKKRGGIGTHVPSSSSNIRSRVLAVPRMNKSSRSKQECTNISPPRSSCDIKYPTRSMLEVRNLRRVCSVRYVPRHTTGITGTGHFGKVDAISIAVPDTSVSSVRYGYRYRLYRYRLSYRYRTLRYVRYNNIFDTGYFGNFGTASIPVPDTSVTSVRHQYRYRTLR